jgi:hypothetical protein
MRERNVVSLIGDICIYGLLASVFVGCIIAVVKLTM